VRILIKINVLTILMETFDGKVDPQRLAKLDKRIGPPEECAFPNLLIFQRLAYTKYIVNIRVFHRLVTCYKE